MKKLIMIVTTIFLGILLLFKSNNVKKLDSTEVDSIIINNEIINDNSYIAVDKEQNFRIISDEVEKISVNYPNFFRTIIQADMKIPIVGNMVPQGITLMDEYVLISAYDSEEKHNSLVYVLDDYGNIINEVNLGNKSHVGGLAYDKNNNLLWIPDDNGILNAYVASDFIDKAKVKYKYRFVNVGKDLKDFMDEEKKLIAFVTMDDEYIYLGNFSKDSESIVKKYRVINKGDKIKLNYINSFMVPAKTQSITFFSKGLKKYMITSNSYQRRKSSYIKVFEYRDMQTRYNKELASIELPPMLEQIAVSNNSVYSIFESKAKKYNNCPEKVEFICVLDIYKFLENIS